MNRARRPVGALAVWCGVVGVVISVRPTVVPWLTAGACVCIAIVLVDLVARGSGRTS